jgi:hypothetical protein
MVFTIPNFVTIAVISLGGELQLWWFFQQTGHSSWSLTLKHMPVSLSLATLIWYDMA